ncbi:CheR family methyltransferase [Nitratidesulfovibrio termitidis]|uniref:CheR family methyltransferase n=1 Tax=Nitratidesulfovibrio termitidis TaxID=42252 RepID=UPI000408937B|nr:protein-glutamate O-methyltransferase [Nitratidesulfovibrio termitidis]
MNSTRSDGPALPPGCARPGPMSQKLFDRMSRFVYEQVGIKLPGSKRVMLEARLQKRLRVLGMASYDQYVDYLFTEKGVAEELRNFIDVVTTNTTEFFREPRHFDYLTSTLLPGWTGEAARLRASRPLRVWSAGCSIGMEPYTLAMVLRDYEERTPGFSFSILATDISSRALQQAVRAVYDEERVHNVPDQFRKRYLLRSRDRTRRLVRIGPELRSAVRFERLNFMDPFSFSEPMDIIFCRNVIIYFDKPTQEGLFSRFCQCLRPGGHLFIGHSESLTGMALPLEQVAPTVYRRTR